MPRCRRTVDRAAAATPAISQRFPFLQLELPGELGLDEGRYLVRAEADGEPEAVLVVTTIGAPPRQTRFAARRSRPEKAGEGPEPLTATRLTIVDSRRPLEEAAAVEWLDAIRRDPDALEAFVANGVAVLNRAIHAQRAASMDPYLSDVAPERASVLRVGYGSGQEVADGRWREALKIPRAPGRRRSRRAAALKPQERVASVLGGREQVAPFETMLLRARLDLDQGRVREAALQLRAGLEALLSDIPVGVGGDELRDLEELDDRREAIEAAAAEAAAGSLSEPSTEQLGETLAICERVIRRRRILGQGSQPAPG
jgi:hypothetical protein